MADKKEMDSYEYARVMRKLDEAVYGDPHQSSSERQKKLDDIHDELTGYDGDWKDRAETRVNSCY